MSRVTSQNNTTASGQYLVPPFDVNPAIITHAAGSLRQSFDAMIASVTSGGENTTVTEDGEAKVELTHQHLGMVFRNVSNANDSYAHLIGSSYPKGLDAANDTDRTHTYEFLMPYAWHQMRRNLERGKNAGHSIAAMRASIDEPIAYWNAAYNQIQNDLLPFIVQGAKVLVLGEGRLVSHIVQVGLKYVNTSSFHILEARPEMPHEELAQLLAAENGSGNGSSPSGAAGASSSAPSSSPASCCGQRLIDRVATNLRGDVSCTSRMQLVPDSCAASMLRECNFVLLGAYAATKNGGIVHRAGSLQLAMLAKSMNIPVYVLCESYKFHPFYPISTASIAQPSIPEGWKEYILSKGGYAGVEAVRPSFVPTKRSGESGPASPTRDTNGASGSKTANEAAAAVPATVTPFSGSLVGASASSSSLGGKGAASKGSAKSKGLAASSVIGSSSIRGGGGAGGAPATVATSGHTSSSSGCEVYGHLAYEHFGTKQSVSTTMASLSLESLPSPKYLEFVPGDLITFFFTDRRILPPSGIVMDINQMFPLSKN